MKKSLVLLVVLVTTVAFASTVLGYWDCYPTPKCKIVCVDKVLCKGKAAGKIKLCGPCAPTIKFKGSWLTVLKCPVAKK